MGCAIFSRAGWRRKFSPVLIDHWFRFLTFRIDIVPFQFSSVCRDFVIFQIDLGIFPVPSLRLDFRPAFDREKEILLDLRTGILHPIPHLHRRKFVVQIDREILLLDRDVGRLFLIRGSSVPCLRNPGLPGAAVSKQSCL